MVKESIILIIIIVVLLTLSIFIITILENKSNDTGNNTDKNITMEDREYSNIVYDIDGNPIDNLVDTLLKRNRWKMR